MAEIHKHYINTAQVSFSVSDLVIEAGTKKDRSAAHKTITPEDIELEIYMSPQYAKTLIIAITQALRMYEEVYGNINLEANQEAVEKLGIATQPARQ